MSVSVDRGSRLQPVVVLIAIAMVVAGTYGLLSRIDTGAPSVSSVKDKLTSRNEPAAALTPNALPRTQATPLSSKKGWSGSSYLKGDLAKVKAMNVSWAYDWGSTSPTKIAGTGIEYVPMVWGGWATDDATIARLQEGARSGRYKNVLAFNEPDHRDQSNLTVDQALELWPRLEAIGLPLGAPAVASLGDEQNTSTPGKPWINDFLDKAFAKGLRVDFIPVHYFQDWTNPGKVAEMKAQLTALHKRYNRPIWVTALGTMDIERAWDIPMSRSATFTAARRYMADVLPMLDSLPFVDRYAWFLDNCWKPGTPVDPCNYTSLYDNLGRPTELGKLYATRR